MTASTFVRFVFFLSVVSAFFHTPGRAATVVGTLQDISIEGLNTKLTFWPTTNVLLTPSGLNAGPPKTINVSNGQFSLPLEAGDYLVSLPLIPWRTFFAISVFPTNGTLNITNLLSAPKTYTYTNNLNWTFNGSNIFFKAGNVGIGITNPQAPLEIVSDGGNAVFGSNPLLHLANSSADTEPTQLLLESSGEGSVGIQLQSGLSPNNWQISLLNDTMKVSKVGGADFLTINSAGRVSAPQGFAVDSAVGLSTNLPVLLPGPKTNTLVFTKGILTGIQ
jgi:hypothetical protein